jgi:hypothetical protein
MLEWLLKFLVIWLSIDIIIIATVWYCNSTLKPFCPDWWRRVIVDDSLDFKK